MPCSCIARFPHPIPIGSHRQHALYIWDKATGSLVKMLTGQKGETLLDVAVRLHGSPGGIKVFLFPSPSPPPPPRVSDISSSAWCGEYQVSTFCTWELGGEMMKGLPSAQVWELGGGGGDDVCTWGISLCSFQDTLSTLLFFFPPLVSPRPLLPVSGILCVQ